MKKMALVFILFTSTLQVLACGCRFPDSVKKAFEKSDLVIMGKVLSKQVMETEDGNYVLFKIEVFHNYKGENELLTRTLLIKTHPAAPSCGYSFEVGRKYLIYATQDGVYYQTSQCTRTTTKHVREGKKIKALEIRKGLKP